jgi:hypothetical protein
VTRLQGTESAVSLSRAATLAPVLAAVLIVVACGGGKASRSKLEHALAKGGKAICDGNCKTFHAKAATCAASGTLVGGRRFYRCRVVYDNGGPADRVCAALDGSAAVFRPLRTCKR